MKSLLLIAYHFPPEPVAGAIRTGILAKHLSRRGWHVSVLTAESAITQTQSEVIFVPDPFRRTRSAPAGATGAAQQPGLLKQVVYNSYFPDRQIAWVPGVLRIARRLLSMRSFDAVLSSALPFSTHIAASRISARYGIPWIADYRDLYAGNPYTARIRSGALAAMFERRILRRARTITTVSNSLAASLQRLHKGIPVELIPNAVDLEEALEATIPPRAFRICYTGALYGGRRNPEPLFEALVKLRHMGHEAGCETQVDFYGPDTNYVEELADRYGLRNCVRTHGQVPQHVAREAQREAAVLLVVLNMDEQTVGEYGSKVLEYAAVRRPILAIGPAKSVLRPLMSDKHLGHFASDADECAKALVVLYEKFKAGVYQTNPSEDFRLYAAPELASAFEHVLLKVTA